MPKCCINRFHKLKLLFWTKQTFKKGKNSRPKIMVQRSSCVLLRILTKKEDLLVLKMDADQLPHEIYAIVGSNKLRQKQMRRTRRNRKVYR